MEIIDRYRQLNGCIFKCFLDASKAFDTVKYSSLFRKLVNVVLLAIIII